MKNPGCYGVPSVFSFTSRVCGGCGSFEGCQRQSHDTLKLLPSNPGVQAMLLKHENHLRQKEGLSPLVPKSRQKNTITEEQEQQVRSLPKKVGDYLRKLFKRGEDIKIRECAGKGENPFTEEKSRPYRVAFEYLLDGGFTKRFLRTAFMEEMGWSEASAFSQVSIVWHVFVALGVAEESGCALVPTSLVQTRGQKVRYGG